MSFQESQGLGIQSPLWQGARPVRGPPSLRNQELHDEPWMLQTQVASFAREIHNKAEVLQQSRHIDPIRDCGGPWNQQIQVSRLERRDISPS